MLCLFFVCLFVFVLFCSFYSYKIVIGVTWQEDAKLKIKCNSDWYYNLKWNLYNFKDARNHANCIYIIQKVWSLLSMDLYHSVLLRYTLIDCSEYLLNQLGFKRQFKCGPNHEQLHSFPVLCLNWNKTCLILFNVIFIFYFIFYLIFLFFIFYFILFYFILF